MLIFNVVDYGISKDIYSIIPILRKRPRNKSESILKRISESNGMIGFSLYPHHLKNGSNCELNNFCEMIAKTADKIGVKNLGIGSDLCQDQPDRIVNWMRNGRWTRDQDFGEDDSSYAGFPDELPWFKDNRDFPGIAGALLGKGFVKEEVEKIMGGNWLRFIETAFRPT